MGVGSSKPDKQASNAATSKRAHHHSAPVPVTKSETRYGIEDSYHTPKPLQRSQSTKSPYDASGITERRDKRSHRAFASEGGAGNGQFYFDPGQSKVDPVSSRPLHLIASALPAYSQQKSQPLRNPLPLPPKDLFAPSPAYESRRMNPPLANPLPSPPDFSRIQFANPAPFIPISPDELNKRRKASLRDKGRGYAAEVAATTRGKVVPVHRAEPSSSLSSHSSASTSNPPAQVIQSSLGGFTMLQNTKKYHDPGLTGNAKSKPRKRGFFSSFLPTFSSSPPKEIPSALVRRPSRNDHQPSPHTHLNGQSAISHPYALGARLPPPPTRPPIAFYDPREPYYGFTTFSPHKILYRKRLYHTAEHLYQAMKFIPDKGRGGDSEAAEQIRNCSEHPADAVLQGRLLNKKAKPDWKAMRTVWVS